MNIAAVLKSEITRLARKELKAETEAIKRSTAKYRSEIAGLKREVAELQRQVKALSKGIPENRSISLSEDHQPVRIRFSAQRLAARRQKLGLSAQDFGKLIGVSGQTIYHWEAEKSRPRDGQLVAVAAVRKMGKREAMAALMR